MPKVRCQVPGCEVDIRELKGYHRRHRVCLQCANAPSVVIEGEQRRYCQQCGKFHLLLDFDEGKRSCRRKLERHNRRRRRRPADLVSAPVTEKKQQEDLSVEATSLGESRNVNEVACETALSTKAKDGDMLFESDDGHGSPAGSIPSTQGNNVMSYAVPGEACIDEEKDNSKSALSSTICDNRSAYSSVCPTGRISFKLYDWNPAEFPRRLRHQIFQWLASMPVELEGYVRPGCTILTIFIAMPQFMWEKLSGDATLYVRNLVNAPDSLFLGRGNIFIFLNNMIIQVLKDGSSLMNIKMEVKAPKLHYVHPNYFEAGKPMDFVVCGSNLDQPKFRFLVSFAGDYVIYDSCFAISHGKMLAYDGKNDSPCLDSEHEVFRICISKTDSKVYGPAFIEVENESGVSNFLPILIGNEPICAELERMQVAVNGSFADSLATQISTSGVHPSLCQHFVAHQTALSELLVDIAWLLKQPCTDGSAAVFSSRNLRRITCLLKISIQNELVNVLKMLLNYLDGMIGIVHIQNPEDVIPEADRKLLEEYINHAKEIVNRSTPHVRKSEDSTSNRSTPHIQKSEVSSSSSQIDVMQQSCAPSAKKQDVEPRNRGCMCSAEPSSRGSNEHEPLVGKAMVDRKHCYPHVHLGWPRQPWADRFPRTITGTRLAVILMASVVLCLGTCVVLLHPLNPGGVAASLRMCLFGYPLP